MATRRVLESRDGIGERITGDPGSLFPFKNLFFAKGSPAIAAQGAVLAGDTVAGDQVGDAIAADCISDRAAGLRAMNDVRDLGIGRGLAEGNVEQGFPDKELELRAPEVEAECWLGLKNQGDEFFRKVVVADQLGMGEFGAQ